MYMPTQFVNDNVFPMIQTDTFYIKKVAGANKPVLTRYPPIYGGVPYWYRKRDISLSGKWFANNGSDLVLDLNSLGNTKPLLAKFLLDGNTTELKSGAPATVVGSINYDAGVYNRRMYSAISNTTGANYIKSAILPISNTKEFTISGFIKPVTQSSTEIIAWSMMVSDSATTAQQKLGFTTNAIMSSTGFTGTTGYATITGNIPKQLRGKKGSPIHIVQTFSTKEMKLYINGVLVGVTYPTTNLFATVTNAYLSIGSKFTANGARVQLVEVYSGVASDIDAVTLYNQQKLELVPSDGKPTGVPDVTNPASFAYYEKNGMLVTAIVNPNTKKVSSVSTAAKIGHVGDTTNYYVKNDAGRMVDRFGNSVPGLNPRVYSAQANTLATTGNANQWVSFNRVTIPSIDTENFDYFVEISCCVSKTADNSGGTIRITVNGKAVGAIDIFVGNTMATNQPFMHRFKIPSVYASKQDVEISADITIMGSSTTNTLTVGNGAGSGTDIAGMVVANVNLLTVTEIPK